MHEHSCKIIKFIAVVFKGALTGYLTSLAVLLWIGFGTAITKTKSIARWPSVSTESCNWNVTGSHMTQMSQNTTVPVAPVNTEFV